MTYVQEQVFLFEMEKIKSEIAVLKILIERVQTEIIEISVVLNRLL